MKKNLTHIEVDNITIICTDDVIASGLIQSEYNTAKKQTERKIDRIIKTTKPKDVVSGCIEQKYEDYARERLYKILK